MERMEALNLVIREFQRATENHGRFNSNHEGYAVIAEELDELWDEVKKKGEVRDVDKLREEACQVTAMGLRFMVDLT